MTKLVASLVFSLAVVLVSPVQAVAACPTARAKKLVESFRKPDELGHFEVAAVRQCKPFRFNKRRAYWVVGTFGQPDGSKAEVGWTIYRFIMTPGGKLIARGPTGGAGWITGVSVGKVRFVDLDADGSHEIIEIIDRYLTGPNHPTRVLRLWTKRKNKLIRLLALPIRHTVGELHDMTGEMDIPIDAKPNCVARHRIVRNGRLRVIELRYKNTVPASAPRLPRINKGLAIAPARKLSNALAKNKPVLLCLPSGRFRVELRRGKLVVRKL